MKNIYAIRKGILKAMKGIARGGNAEDPAAVMCDDLINLQISPELMYASPEDIRQEWRELKSYGYIEQAIPGFEGKYCKISRKGLEQLSIEFPQDYFIHGPGAIK